MGEPTYSILFAGALKPGIDPHQAADALAQRLKLEPERARALLNGKPRVIKRGLDAAASRRYQALFDKIGAIVEVRPEGTSTETQPTDHPPRAELPPPERVDELFRGEVDRLRPTWTYRLALLGTAALVLLLPLLYLALALGVLLASGWYATHGLSFLPRGFMALIFGYLLPVVTGVTVGLFMLKPLFAPARVRPSTYELRPEREPLLFAFVHAIADRVGAPRPRAIAVDCQVNAAAYFHSGLSRKALTLNLGLPLIAGMTTRQLSGILAHEFGHFAQGAGMRANALIRAIMHWLARAAYERDAWDDRLQGLAESEQEYVNNFFTLVLWMVALVRLLLKGLLGLAGLLTNFLSRQMEYDADRYEAQVAGSDRFRDTSYRLRLLTHAFSAATADLNRTWEERRLVNDLPGMIAQRAAALEPQLRETILREMEERQTEIFDTHPGDMDRVRNAEAVQAPGVFHLELPARELLRRYDEYARLVTLRWYRGDVGLKVEEGQLIDLAQLDAKVSAAKGREEAFEAFFNGAYRFHRTPACPDPAPFAGLDDATRRQALEERVIALRRMMPEIEQANTRYGEFRERRDRAFLAHSLQGIGLEPEELLGPCEPWERVTQEQPKHEQGLARHEALFYERMAIALADADRGPATLLKVQALLADTRDLFEELEQVLTLYSSLAYLDRAAREHDPESGGLIDERHFDFYLRQMDEASARLSARLQRIPYPFQRAGERVSVDAHIREAADPPSGNRAADAHSLARTLLQGIAQFNYRLLNELAQITLERERALGVPPIKVRLAPVAG